MDDESDKKTSVYARCINFLMKEAVRDQLPQIQKVLSDAYKKILDVEKGSKKNGSKF